jgi:hypothetical protein
MKRELALQLLQTILPGLGDEGHAAELFRELQLLADYKYNKYEMYHPGRQFLENLYLWLLQFTEEERLHAIRFVREELIFISRIEFEQLAQILYHDKIRRHQLQVAATLAHLPTFRVRAARESPAFKEVTRASLYVGMSDGARIDYVRRHNLDINNEQVVPYYRVDAEKIQELLRDLRTFVAHNDAQFRCLFLVDDFCGSGKTLLRELLVAPIEGICRQPKIPPVWESRLRFNAAKNTLEMLFQGELTEAENQELLQMSEGANYTKAVDTLLTKSKKRETVLTGALLRVARLFNEVLHAEATVCFCPLLITEQALHRLQALVTRLPGKLARTTILPGAILSKQIQVTSPQHPIGMLCEKYYRPQEMEDMHTGSVKYGLEDCGLPLVLHHNTPNNSLFLLWMRKSDAFSPLFVRYERHGREGA